MPGFPALLTLLLPLVALSAGLIGYWLAGRLRGKKPAPVAAPTPTLLPAGFGQALLDGLPTALIVIGLDGRVAYANPAALALVQGATAGELVGSHVSGMIRAPAFVEALGAVIAGAAARNVSFSLGHRRENQFEARLARLPAGGGFGAAPQIIAQIEDRSRERQAIQSRSDFVANASHELRTPLAAIIGYIETLQGHARGDPEAQAHFLQIMAGEAARMQRLIDGLMLLSRVEMSEHSRPEGNCDLGRIARDAMAALAPLAAERGVRIVPADGAGPLVRGDSDQLQQVMVNLIDNAIKYSAPGQTVQIAPAAPNPAYARMTGLSVIDEGIGIERHHIPRLTERFFRVSAGPERGGSGLGLAITKHILLRHDGALDIASTPGKGSRFSVYLPAMADGAPESGAKSKV